MSQDVIFTQKTGTDPSGFLLGDNNLSDVSSASLSRDSLGLGSAATHDATDFDSAGAAAPDVNATTTTTNGVQQVIATYTPAHNTIVHVEGSFLAIKQGGVDARYQKVTAAFLTDNSGAVSIIGSPIGGDTHATSGASSWATTLNTDGAVVRFLITGASSTNINWTVIGEAQVGS